MSFEISYCPRCGVLLNLEHERALMISLGNDDKAHLCGLAVKCEDLRVTTMEIECPEGLPHEDMLQQSSEMHCPQCNQMMLQHKKYPIAYCCIPCNLMLSVETEAYKADEEESK